MLCQLAQHTLELIYLAPQCLRVTCRLLRNGSGRQWGRLFGGGLWLLWCRVKRLVIEIIEDIIAYHFRLYDSRRSLLYDRDLLFVFSHYVLLLLCGGRSTHSTSLG